MKTYTYAKKMIAIGMIALLTTVMVGCGQSTVTGLDARSLETQAPPQPPVDDQQPGWH